MCPDRSCSPSSVLQLKSTRSPFEWYSFYLIFIIPSCCPGCDAFADTKGCWGCRRAAAEPPQNRSLQPRATAMVRPCRLLVCPKADSIYVACFLQQMPIFQCRTLHFSLSLWVCKLPRLRKRPCLLFPLSLSHDFLLKARALLRQSVRFNILFKLNVLG